MTDLEMGIVCFVNELHRKNIYRYDKYLMLHNVKYNSKMDLEHINLIREQYKSNCLEAAYELKTYYSENNILSNTIVLKMRPDTPKSQEFRSIKIYSEAENSIREYTHHVVEVFVEHGRYKVLDILHTDKVMWLETYLDDICSVNNCSGKELRYDMGYLAPCHVFANNMQELSDLMRYLDKKYCIGKPSVNLMNVPNSEGFILSDDIFMDFDEFGKTFQADYNEIISVWPRIYDRLMGVRYNLLHMICLGHISKEYMIRVSMEEAMFDDAKICKLMESRGK